VKALELIAKLQASVEEHGDLPITVFDGDGGFCAAVGISVCMDKNDSAISITVCDAETMEAFS